MRFDVITLFPELFEPFLKVGVTRRAFETGQVQVKLWNLRDFAEGNYRRVDDRPFGGGPGMVMMAEPLARCLQAVRAENAAAPVVLFSPIGQRIDHAGVERWYQRGPLAAGCNVTAAEVANHVDLRELGQCGAVEQLKGVALAVELAGPVPYGLAVGADRAHFLGRQLTKVQHFRCAVGVDGRKRIAGEGSAVELVRPGRVQR